MNKRLLVLHINVCANFYSRYQEQQKHTRKRMPQTMREHQLRLCRNAMRKQNRNIHLNCGAPLIDQQPLQHH